MSTVLPPLGSILSSAAPPAARADFSNQAEWITVRDVPLIDSHILTDDRGTPRLPIDAGFLEQVAQNNNARYQRTGDATPGVIGHTSDDPTAPERPVRCWFTDFRVRTGPNGKPTLFASQHVKKKFAHILEDYPRRSIELWVGKREIDPVALLGGTTPERDLGVTKYTRDCDAPVIRYSRAANDHVYKYTLEPPMTVPNGYPPPGGFPVISGLHGPDGRPIRYEAGEFPPKSDSGPPGEGGGDEGGDDPIIAKMVSSAAFKAAIRSAVEEVMSEMDGGDEEGMEGDMGAPPGSPMGAPPGAMGAPPPGGPPGGPPGSPMGGPPPMPEAAQFHGPPPVRFNEGMSYPGSSNMFIPDNAPERMSRNGDAMYYDNRGYPVGGYTPPAYTPPYTPPGYPVTPQRLGYARPVQYQQAAPQNPQTDQRLSAVETENRSLKLRLARADAMEYVRGTLMAREGLKIDDPEYLAEQLANFEFVPNGIAARNEFIEKVVRKNFARQQPDPTQTLDIMRYARTAQEGQQQVARGPQSHEEVMGLVRYARANNIADMATAWAQMCGKK